MGSNFFFFFHSTARLDFCLEPVNARGTGLHLDPAIGNSFSSGYSDDDYSGSGVFLSFTGVFGSDLLHAAAEGSSCRLLRNCSLINERRTDSRTWCLILRLGDRSQVWVLGNGSSLLIMDSSVGGLKQ